MNVVSECVSPILSIWDRVIRTYEQNEEIIRQAEAESQDLLHEIELAAPKNGPQGYLLYKALRDARVRRREAKNENELLAPLYQFCKDQVEVRKELQKIQGAGDRTADRLAKRSYHPKERSDLTITNHRPDVNRPLGALLQEHPYARKECG